MIYIYYLKKFTENFTFYILFLSIYTVSVFADNKNTIQNIKLLTGKLIKTYIPFILKWIIQKFKKQKKVELIYKYLRFKKTNLNS